MFISLTTTKSKLRVREGMFEVLYPDAQGKFQQVQHAPALVESIWINDGTEITTAALRLAMQNNIDVVICDRHGDPEGRMLSLRPSTTSLVQKAQALASVSIRGLEYARGWAVRKLATQADLIEKLAKRRGDIQKEALSDPLRIIGEAKVQMQEIVIGPAPAPAPSEVAQRIRGLEGVASKAFFEALSRIIPDQYRFSGRSRRPAKDAFNAMLNYAFAVLYRKVERALVAAGLNTYIGFLHRDGYQFKSMVFDFIEPYRSDMVQAVFALFARKQVNLSIHTHSAADDSVRLSKEGKTLLLQKINRFYEKKIETEGIRMDRDRIMARDAQRFAQALVSTSETSVEIETAELLEDLILN